MNKKTILIGIVLTFCYSISYGQTSWTQKANFPGDFWWQSVGFSIGDKGYVGTGTSMPGEMHNEFWEYDTAMNIWTQKASLPVALEEAVGFSIGNKGYIGTGNTADYEYSTNQFFEYDPIADTWTEKANFGGSNRQHAFAFSINGKGYIGGGGIIGIYRNDLWEYDAFTDTWTQKSSMPISGLTGGIAFVIENKAYVGIGLYPGGNYNIFFEYDPIADTWTQKGYFPGTERWEAVAFSIGNYGYVGTGLYPYTNDFWQYNPINDSWLQLDSFPGAPRYDAVGFSIGNAGYLGLGSGQQDFYKFTPPFTTSINSTINNNEKEKIFPNPTTGRATIKTNYPVNNISILNSALKEVKYYDNLEKSFEIEIDFSRLSSGIYFIKIKYKNGKTSSTKILFYH